MMNKNEQKLKEMLSKCKILIGINVDDTSEDELLRLLLIISESECIRTVYPLKTNFEEFELPNQYDLWIIQTVKYLYENRNYSNMIKYSENGIEIEFNSNSNNGIPLSHYAQLTPYASGIADE